MTADNINNALSALQDARFNAFDVTDEPGATDIRIETGRGWLCLAVGFNREGWEAVLENDDQQPLMDGPDSPTADSALVVRWVRELVVDLDTAGEVLEAFMRATAALISALAIWQEMEPDRAAFLLDQGYPFGEALEEVVAKANDYCENLAHRVGRA